jgi:mono/diheme cytochrome c family protein
MSDATSRSLPRLAKALAIAVTAAAVVAGAMAAFIAFGVYDIGADAPHTKPVFQLISALRDRSIMVRAKAITPPADLASPDRVALGAHLYGGLCVSCHLGPELPRTDLSRGLYPKAPPLAYGNTLTPAQTFWIVKHGIKLTAMPAWGKTHSDAEIWDLVAFLRKMPDMDPAQYQAAVGGGAKPAAP